MECLGPRARPREEVRRRGRWARVQFSWSWWGGGWRPWRPCLEGGGLWMQVLVPLRHLPRTGAGGPPAPVGHASGGTLTHQTSSPQPSFSIVRGEGSVDQIWGVGPRRWAHLLYESLKGFPKSPLPPRVSGPGRGLAGEVSPAEEEVKGSTWQGCTRMLRASQAP